MGTELRGQGRCDETETQRAKEKMELIALQCEIFTEEIKFVGRGCCGVILKTDT